MLNGTFASCVIMYGPAAVPIMIGCDISFAQIKVLHMKMMV